MADARHLRDHPPPVRDDVRVPRPDHGPGPGPVSSSSAHPSSHDRHSRPSSPPRVVRYDADAPHPYGHHSAPYPHHPYTHPHHHPPQPPPHGHPQQQQYDYADPHRPSSAAYHPYPSQAPHDPSPALHHRASYLPESSSPTAHPPPPQQQQPLVGAPESPAPPPYYPSAIPRPPPSSSFRRDHLSPRFPAHPGKPNPYAYHLPSGATADGNANGAVTTVAEGDASAGSSSANTSGPASRAGDTRSPSVVSAPATPVMADGVPPSSSSRPPHEAFFRAAAAADGPYPASAPYPPPSHEHSHSQSRASGQPPLPTGIADRGPPAVLPPRAPAPPGMMAPAQRHPHPHHRPPVADDALVVHGSAGGSGGGGGGSAGASIASSVSADATTRMLGGPPRKTAKSHVPSACLNCKKAHLACDVSRPCHRCVNLGKSATCYDVQHKKRGRPRLKDKEAAAGAFNAATVPLATANMPPQAPHMPSYNGFSHSDTPPPMMGPAGTYPVHPADQRTEFAGFYSPPLQRPHHARETVAARTSSQQASVPGSGWDGPRGEPMQPHSRSISAAAVVYNPVEQDPVRPPVRSFSGGSGLPPSERPLTPVHPQGPGGLPPPAGQVQAHAQGHASSAPPPPTGPVTRHRPATSSDPASTVTIILSTTLSLARISQSSLALLGFYPTELLETSLFSLLHPDDDQALTALLSALLSPIGIRPQVVPASARTVLGSPFQALEVPANGTVWVTERMRLRQRSGKWDWWSIQLHIGGGFGADLYRPETLEKAYVVAKMVRLTGGDDEMEEPPDLAHIRNIRYQQLMGYAPGNAPTHAQVPPRNGPPPPAAPTTTTTTVVSAAATDPRSPGYPPPPSHQQGSYPGPSPQPGAPRPSHPARSEPSAPPHVAPMHSTSLAPSSHARPPLSANPTPPASQPAFSLPPIQRFHTDRPSPAPPSHAAPPPPVGASLASSVEGPYPHQQQGGPPVAPLSSPAPSNASAHTAPSPRQHSHSARVADARYGYPPSHPFSGRVHPSQSSPGASQEERFHTRIHSGPSSSFRPVSPPMHSREWSAGAVVDARDRDFDRPRLPPFRRSHDDAARMDSGHDKAAAAFARSPEQQLSSRTFTGAASGVVSGTFSSGVFLHPLPPPAAPAPRPPSPSPSSSSSPARSSAPGSADRDSSSSSQNQTREKASEREVRDMSDIEEEGAGRRLEDDDGKGRRGGHGGSPNSHLSSSRHSSDGRPPPRGEKRKREEEEGDGGEGGEGKRGEGPKAGGGGGGGGSGKDDEEKMDVDRTFDRDGDASLRQVTGGDPRRSPRRGDASSTDRVKREDGDEYGNSGSGSGSGATSSRPPSADRRRAGGGSGDCSPPFTPSSLPRPVSSHSAPSPPITPSNPSPPAIRSRPGMPGRYQSSSALPTKATWVSGVAGTSDYFSSSFSRRPRSSGRRTSLHDLTFEAATAAAAAAAVTIAGRRGSLPSSSGSGCSVSPAGVAATPGGGTGGRRSSLGTGRPRSSSKCLPGDSVAKTGLDAILC